MKELATAIRERLAEKGLTHATAARKLGIGRQAFSRKLNGHNDFKVDELTRLAEILGTTVIDLMQRADKITNADVAPTRAGYAIKDQRSSTVIMQARHVDIGGETA